MRDEVIGCVEEMSWLMSRARLVRNDNSYIVLCLLGKLWVLRVVKNKIIKFIGLASMVWAWFYTSFTLPLCFVYRGCMWLKYSNISNWYVRHAFLYGFDLLLFLYDFRYYILVWLLFCCWIVVYGVCFFLLHHTDNGHHWFHFIDHYRPARLTCRRKTSHSNENLTSWSLRHLQYYTIFDMVSLLVAGQ